MTATDGAGLPPYLGYNYQIAVTVWTGLDLMVERSLCKEIEIEPASLEDVAAALHVPPESEDAGIHSQTANGVIHIQIKHRSNSWSEADFRALLKTPAKRGARGPQPRNRALTLLQADDRLHYLLITDAEVHSNLKALVVTAIGDKSAAKAIKDITDNAELACRVAIVEKRLERYVERDADDILEKKGRVPAGNVTACRKEIAEAVRQRLLGRRESSLTLAELDSIIERHNGRPPTSSDDFVPPSNYLELERRLEAPPYALLLTGEPGIGKTSVAVRLIENLRRWDRPFDVVHNPKPHQVRAALRAPGRMIFYFEDPWGSYKLAQDANLWTDELPRLISDAHGDPDKRFLITSRTGLFADAMGSLQDERGMRAFGAYVARIRTEHFDMGARMEILRRRMRGADRRRRDWVADHAQSIAGGLIVPQALVAFANQVRQLPDDATPKLDKIVQDSQVQAIGAVVARQLRERDEILSAVVLWVFLTTGIKLTEAIEREVSVSLQESAINVDLPRTVKFLVASGWLTRRSEGVEAHPTVVAGIEQVVDAEPAKSDRVIRALLTTLVGSDHIDMATALMLGLQDRKLPIPAAVQSTIERHLREAVLAAADAIFPVATERFIRLTRATDPVCLFAQSLKTVRSQAGVGEEWVPPSLSEGDLAAIGASTEAQVLARRYIRLVLISNTIWHGDAELLSFLQSFGWELTQDFTEAALVALAQREVRAEVLWNGALSVAFPEYDKLLNAALDEYADAERWFHDGGNTLQARAEAGELDAAYSAHVLDEHARRFHPAERALQQVVGSRRSREGFDWIVRHPRRANLLTAWAESIPAGEGDTCRAELLALVERCPTHWRTPAWLAIGRARCRALVEVVLTAIVEGPVNELGACLSALFGMYTVDEMRGILGPTMDGLSGHRRAALVYATPKAEIPGPDDHMYRDPNNHRQCVRDMADAVTIEAVDACSAAAGGDDGIEDLTLSDAVWSRIRELTQGDDECLGALACVVLAHNGHAVGALDRFRAARDDMTRLHALRAIHRAYPSVRDAIRSFLDDDYYQCRRLTMRILAMDPKPDEQAAILQKACDRSAPVREACASIIGHRQWRDALDTLCTLLTDRRDRSEETTFHHGVPDYHVAREAARALGHFPSPLPEKVVIDVLDFLDRGTKACDDPGVHLELIRMIARERDPAVPGLLERYLSSEWYVGPDALEVPLLVEQHLDLHEMGAFPLRYAAAWGWLTYLLHNRAEVSRVPVPQLALAAGHSDERFAAPALVVMGFVGWKSRVHVEQILTGDLMNEERAALLQIGSVLGVAPPLDDVLASRLSHAHPARRLIDWCCDRTLEEDAWKQRFHADRTVQDWLERVRRSTPIHAALRRLLRTLPKGKWMGNVSVDDFRQGELGKRIPFITLFTMAGLE